MSSIDMQAVSKSGFDGLMAPIVKVAAENLLTLAEPDFEFVPAKLRRGMKAVHDRLSGELRALFELLTVYDDLKVCRILAQQYPWQQNEITPYEHLRLAWSQFVRLSDGFERHVNELIQHHREALELFSSDFELPDPGEHSARSGPSQATTDGHDRPVDRWYEVAPKSPGATVVAAGIRVASKWPDAGPPFARHYDRAKSELVHEIDAKLVAVDSDVTGFLVDHGAALIDGIERYNQMIGNFRRLHRP
jgi:hypothetical protein